MRRQVLALAVLLFAAVPATGQTLATPARWVDSIFAPFSRPGVPGCAVGVVQKSVLTLARGYGTADLRRRVPNTPISAFYLASLSKQFTAMSVVLLAHDGRLGLD